MSEFEIPTWIGPVTVHDAENGQIISPEPEARRAREIAAEAEGAIPIGLAKLTGLIDRFPRPGEELSGEQKYALSTNINTIVGIYDKVGEANDADIVRELCDVYFAHQHLLTETAAANVLRLLPDNYALEIDFDLDLAWDIFQQALEEHNRG